MKQLVVVPDKGQVIVYKEDGTVLFEGTQQQLSLFVHNSIYIAECIELDIGAGNIDSELSPMAFEIYENYTRYAKVNLGYPRPIQNSLQLMHQANQEDNDLKYMGLFKKAQREKRWEVFQETVVPILVERNISFHFSEEKYSYTFSSSEHGNVDFFVKANKVHIRVLNKWIEGNAIQWLFKHIINK